MTFPTTPLNIYNSLTRKKELFKPISPTHVGLYVCGPTVYGDPHLGHARPYIVFDVLNRLLTAQGLKVRYVRNITDVGHLENDADEGEDKIAKKARLEQVEPMEVVQFYTNKFRDAMSALNNIPPSIEPTASGHVIEQIKMTQDIINNGYAYEVNGSVYFDVKKYNEDYKYGELSGRILEDMQHNSRTLDGQDEKRNPVDFALWKAAKPEHIMRWPSPWSDGFPGWHLECSVMSTRYLGETFDIHGGGMDLQFPHHEAEIAQCCGANGKSHVNYWMHNNMITINGQKMGKSLGNFITLDDLFSGKNDNLAQAYTPQTIRFFILQAHYRSTVDFSNDALQAAEKGLQRLMNSYELVPNLKPAKESSVNLDTALTDILTALCDDLNTPIAIAHLFDVVKIINNIQAGKETIAANDLADLQSWLPTIVEQILGLTPQTQDNSGANQTVEQLMQLVLDLRADAKENKNWAVADKIRDQLNGAGITVKDTKEGAQYELN
ncbi:MAG: cysteinyl-tRNA synthetase [Flavobacteriales bacterium]|jgi:cysteinyl-tRNA synthetase